MIALMQIIQIETWVSITDRLGGVFTESRSILRRSKSLLRRLSRRLYVRARVGLYRGRQGMKRQQHSSSDGVVVFE